MTTLRISFRVEGRPAGQGSKNRGRNGSSYEASRYLPAWREAVQSAAASALTRTSGWDSTLPAVALHVTFLIQRPRHHFTRKGLRPNAPTWAPVTPDLDKLLRSVGDALTQAGVIADDRRIVATHAFKAYADEHETPGATISVRQVQP